MLNYIHKLKLGFRFYKPGTSKLETGIWLKSGAIAVPLSKGCLIAMTLNEVCVARGYGQALWVSPDSPDWLQNPDIFFRDKTWTKDEQEKFWKTSQLKRLQECEAQPPGWDEGTKIWGLSTKFLQATDEDELISWRATNESTLFLIYKNGQGYCVGRDWLQWFATLSSGHEYQLSVSLKLGNGLEKGKADLRLACPIHDHSSVVALFEGTAGATVDAPKWMFSPRRLPRMDLNHEQRKRLQMLTEKSDQEDSSLCELST